MPFACFDLHIFSPLRYQRHTYMSCMKLCHAQLTGSLKIAKIGPKGLMGWFPRKRLSKILFKYRSWFTFYTCQTHHIIISYHQIISSTAHHRGEMFNLKIRGVATTNCLSAYPFSYLPVCLSVHLHLSIFTSVCTHGPLALVQSPGLRPKGDAFCQKEEENWLGWQLVSMDTVGVGDRSQRQARSCIAISASKEWQTGAGVRDRGEKHHPKTISHLS